MLVPLLCMLLLAVMIGRTAKKNNVSSQLPLAVSVGIFFVFMIFSRGMIKIRSESEVFGAMALALFLYATVVGVLYGVAYAWIKRLSRSRRDAQSPSPVAATPCPRCGAAMSDNSRFCTACGAERTSGG